MTVRLRYSPIIPFFPVPQNLSLHLSLSDVISKVHHNEHSLRNQEKNAEEVDAQEECREI